MPYGITWLLMPPWRSHIIHHDQSEFSYPNHKGVKGEKTNNIYNVVNNGIKALTIFKVLRKAINVFKHYGI